MLGRLIEGLKVVASYVPLLRDNFSTEATGIDTKGYDGALVLVEVGVTDTTVDLHVEESDNDSDYVDITSAEITQLTATDDSSVAAIDIKLTPGSRKRYIRPVLEVGDGSSGANTAVQVLLYNAALAPTTSGADEVVKV